LMDLERHVSFSQAKDCHLGDNSPSWNVFVVMTLSSFHFKKSSL